MNTLDTRSQHQTIRYMISELEISTRNQQEINPTNISKASIWVLSPGRYHKSRSLYHHYVRYCQLFHRKTNSQDLTSDTISRNIHPLREPTAPFSPPRVQIITPHRLRRYYTIDQRSH